MWFDAGFENREGFAEPAGDKLGKRRIRISRQKPVASFEDRRRSAEARARELRGLDSVLRSQARVEPFSPCPLSQKFERAGS